MNSRGDMGVSESRAEGADRAGAPRPAARPRAVPPSTYRLQLSPGHGFAEARALAAYLADLGAGALYSSPVLKARPGSTHGYDVSDHGALNPELGSEEDYLAFCDALAGLGLGHVMDFVPNHMANDPGTNPWWRDVLENGSCSPFARFFDIDWAPVKLEIQGKVLLPILDDQYGAVLERGDLRLEYDTGSLVVVYGSQRLPINPRMIPKVFRYRIEALGAELGEADPHLLEFLSILTALHNMPTYLETDPERIAERRREKVVSRDRLQRLVAASDRIRRHIDEAIGVFNGTAGDPQSFDLLHDLLEFQPYRLAYWKTASHEINYRRFFDINDMAGLRMEDPDVFQATHRLVARLIAEGRITGLRVDHPDGLFDPAQYFRNVQALAAGAEGGAAAPFYVLAEKILLGPERLPENWMVAGTTGYGFLNLLNGLFVADSSFRSLRRIYARLTGLGEGFDQVAYASKKLIMETSMSSELNVLAHELNRISEGNRRSRDFTLNSLRDVLLEVVACFPIYRTYVSAEGWGLADREAIDSAIRLARRRNPVMESSIFDFLREVLLPRPVPSAPRPGAGAEAERRAGYPPADAQEFARRLYFARRFQQYTGPVQAKGIEDTGFYRYNVLLSLNDVGGAPEHIGRSPADFHRANLDRLGTHPYELLATSTHDSKLGEDVRARLNVLSELTDEWRREVALWMRLNAPARRRVNGDWAPDRNDEYRFYQALVGAWPAELSESREALAAAPPGLVDRLAAYMLKAAREAKVHTSWVNSNRAYDEAIEHFVRHSLTGPGAARFLGAFHPFQRRVARLGLINSLAQVTLKIAAPGVPDFYQGTELWDLNLVDPDNRRPVDFDRRRRLLAEVQACLPDELWAPDAKVDVGARAAAVAALVERWTDGRIKLALTACGLRLRRRHADLLLEGAYQPLEADAAVPAGLVAFARSDARHALLAVAPRLVAAVAGPQADMPLGTAAWKTTRILLPADLAARPYRNLLTGEEVRPVQYRDQAWIFAGDALRHCPVAWLWGAASTSIAAAPLRP